MKLKRLLLSLTVCFNTLAAPLLVAVPAHAATAANCQREAGGFLNFPTWYKYLNPRFDGKECKLDFDPKQDIPKVALAVFEILLRISGLVAVGFIIYGGFLFLLSQGEPERTKNARGTIINALIGLTLALFATAIVNLIANGIT